MKPVNSARIKGLALLVGLVVFAILPLYFIESRDGSDLLVRPDGFSYVRTIGQTHMILVDASQLGESSAQQRASAFLCDDLEGRGNYCELFLFRDAVDIPKSFPIKRNSRIPMGSYKRQSEKPTQFRRLAGQ